MTIRKNITLKDPYDQMYQDLKSRGEFKRSYGSFSEFIQAMVEEFHDNPDAVREEYHKEKVNFHKKMRQNFQELSEENRDEGIEDLEEEEKEFFNNFLELLNKKKGSKEWRNDHISVYEKYENGWIRKYKKKFTAIQEPEFRKKLQSYCEENQLQELEILQKVQV